MNSSAACCRHWTAERYGSVARLPSKENPTRRHREHGGHGENQSQDGPLVFSPVWTGMFSNKPLTVAHNSHRPPPFTILLFLKSVSVSSVPSVPPCWVEHLRSNQLEVELGSTKRCRGFFAVRRRAGRTVLELHHEGMLDPEHRIGIEILVALDEQMRGDAIVARCSCDHMYMRGTVGMPAHAQ